MAIDLLRVDEERINGIYKINTSAAYRGCAAYVSGVTSGVWYVALPTTSALSKLCRGIVTQWPLVETGADTADVTDKLAKDSRVCYVEGPVEARVYGNAVYSALWASVYWTGGLGAAMAVNATANWKPAYISIKAGHCGKWVCTSRADLSGMTTSTTSIIAGSKVKVLELTGASAKGCELRIDVDWNRNEFIAIS